MWIRRTTIKSPVLPTVLRRFICGLENESVYDMDEDDDNEDDDTDEEADQDSRGAFAGFCPDVQRKLGQGPVHSGYESKVGHHRGGG